MCVCVCVCRTCAEKMETGCSCRNFIEAKVMMKLTVNRYN